MSHGKPSKFGANPSYYTMLFIPISIYLLIMSSLLFSSPRIANAAWHVEIDATERSFLEKNRFSELRHGFTDVVPPSGIPQSYRADPTDDGYIWTLLGTELSVWQTTEIPASARYLLCWSFLYEGNIAEGRGRAGFIFGNPASLDLLSVELTHAGTLRLIRWGKREGKAHGDIVWSGRAGRASGGRIKIQAAYDMREDLLVCHVNDGEAIKIELGRYMPAPPMTIRAVGFFAAVPEAARNRFSMNDRVTRDHEIDLSRRGTKAIHRYLGASGW